MGGVCPGCFRGADQEEKAYQFDQLRTSEEDRVSSDEARANAAISAQKRAEAFEKSAVGKAARTAIAAAKAPAPSRSNEPGLKWTMG